MKTLEDLRNENEVDNSKLEEMLERFFDMQDREKLEFIDLFKESCLYMPIVIDESAFDLENSKAGEIIQTEIPMGFSINSITQNGKTTVPLFTSDEAMKKSGVKSSTFVLYMADLAEMLKGNEKYSTVTVNPFSEHGLDIEIETFLGMFEKPEKEFSEMINEIMEILDEHSIELEENATLVLRSDENIMVENAENGVFVPKLPFYASSNPKYREDLKYTNILLMPKSKKICPVGPDNELDVIIAPGSEFKLEDVMDGTTNLWMCGRQPFYD